MRIVTLVVLLFLAVNVQGKEIAGITLPETINHEDGTLLQLNGAGIRSKFIIKVYIAQLYLADKKSEVASILAEDGHRRMIMHFLYDEVDKKALVDAWNEGFQANGSDELLGQLTSEIETFNNYFVTVKKSDRIVLDYVPGTGTSVFIRDEKMGTISGKKFNDLLLSIWLGEKPVNKGLKNKLLGK